MKSSRTSLVVVVAEVARRLLIFMFLWAAAGVTYLYRLCMFVPIGKLMTHIRQLIRFAVSGVTGAFVGLVATYILTEFGGVWYVWSSIFAFIVASTITFLLQKFWTFKEHSVNRVHIQATQTLFLALFILVFNTILIYLFVDLLHLHYLVAQCLIYGLIGIIDFILYKFIIFRR